MLEIYQTNSPVSKWLTCEELCSFVCRLLMIKSLIMSDEPKLDTINKLNRIANYMNNNVPLLVSDGYCIKQ